MANPTVPARSEEHVERETLSTKLNTEINAIESELHRLEQAQGSAAQDQNVEDAAERVISGEIAIDECWVAPLEQIEELTARRRVLARAIEKLAPVLAQDREQHARATAAVWRPLHKEATSRIARALVELMRANKDEAAIRSQFPGNYLPTMNLVGLGAFGAGGGLAQQWKDYAKQQAYWPEGL